MTNQTQSDSIFLATTALEDFWDTSKPITFLGEWCLLYERREYWRIFGGNQIKNQYEHVDAGENAYKFVNNLYEKLLPLLGEKLNDIHAKSHSDRYWRILLGPWLHLYLSAVYDRFLHLTKAIEEIPNFTTIGLSTASFVVPTDTLGFACLLSEDSYNLQLYTKLLHALGKEFPCKEATVQRSSSYGKLLKNTWQRKLISYAIKLFANVSTKLFKTILLRNPYFSKSIETQLIIHNFGRILPCWNQINSCHEFDLDSKKRNKLKKIEVGHDEFEQCLVSILFSDVPQCFIEGYSAVENEKSKNYPEYTSAILSANGWYYDEIFKQWSAAAAEDGVILLGTQHGGNYGCLKNMASEDHEMAIVDNYYSWGWGQPDSDPKVIPMPATKLMGRTEIGADNSKHGILWAATSSQRYVVQFPFLPSDFQQYLDWQLQFGALLSEEMVKITRFRPHYENYGWGTVERIRKSIPDIQIESWDKPFQQSLENCRLYVCDHLSTTFAEALALNKPTLLFWNPLTTKLRPEAQPIFDSLRECEILFDTPQTAALAVNNIYQDVAAWWNLSKRQEAVRKFCTKFARTSPNAIALWGDELTRVAELKSSL